MPFAINPYRCSPDLLLYSRLVLLQSSHLKQTSQEMTCLIQKQPVSKSSNACNNT